MPTRSTKKHGVLTTVLLDAVRVNDHGETRAWVLERNNVHYTGIRGKRKVKIAICWGNDSTNYELQDDEVVCKSLLHGNEE